jgi:hypothetical protein
VPCIRRVWPKNGHLVVGAVPVRDDVGSLVHWIKHHAAKMYLMWWNCSAQRLADFAPAAAMTVMKALADLFRIRQPR